MNIVTNMIDPRRQYTIISNELMEMIGVDEAMVIRIIYTATQNRKLSEEIDGAVFIDYSTRKFQDNYARQISKSTVNRIVSELRDKGIVIELEGKIGIHYVNLLVMASFWEASGRPLSYSKSEDADKFRGAYQQFRFKFQNEDGSFDTASWVIDEEDAEEFLGLSQFGTDDKLSQFGTLCSHFVSQFGTDDYIYKKIKDNKDSMRSVLTKEDIERIATLFARWSMEHDYLEQSGYRKPKPPVHPSILHNYVCQFDSLPEAEQKDRIKKAKAILKTKTPKKVWVIDAIEKKHFGEDYFPNLEEACMVQVLVVGIGLPRYELPVLNMAQRLSDYRDSIKNLPKAKEVKDIDYGNATDTSYDLPD